MIRVSWRVAVAAMTWFASGCAATTAPAVVVAAPDDTDAIREYARATGAKVNPWTEGKLSLYMPKETTDDNLVALGKLAPAWLGAVQLHPCDKISDAGFLALTSLPGLESISLPPQLTDAAYADMARRFPKVHYVEVTAAKGKPPVLTNVALKSIATLKLLSGLDAPATAVDDSCWEELAKLPELRGIRIGSPKLTGAGIRRLARNAQFSGITLIDAPLSDAGVREIAGLESLVNLHFTRCGMTDARVAALAGLPALKFFSLGGNPITDEALKSVAKMRSVAVVEVTNSPMTDAGLMNLKGASALTNVNLEGTKVTDQGVAAFNMMMPKVQVNK